MHFCWGAVVLRSEPDLDAKPFAKVDGELVAVDHEGVVCAVLLDDADVWHALRLLVHLLTDLLRDSASDFFVATEGVADDPFEPGACEVVSLNELEVDVA